MPDGQCMILEFKPDTEGQRKKGFRQLDRYRPIVERYYRERIASGQGDAAGKDAITTAIKLKCMSVGDVELEVDVAQYPLCARRFECTR